MNIFPEQIQSAKKKVSKFDKKKYACFDVIVDTCFAMVVDTCLAMIITLHKVFFNRLWYESVLI